VIHNVSFDIGFITSSTASAAPIVRALIDTLMLARRKHPGVSNRLDDLCSRYAIDNSRRTKHGALLDAELLAEVYIDLIGARQSQLILATETRDVRAGGYGEMPRRVREAPLAPRVTDEDRAAHRAFVATLGDKPSGEFRAAGRNQARSRLVRLCLSGLRRSLPLQIFAIHRRNRPDPASAARAAIAHRRRDDLACEREQQPRALDHDQRCRFPAARS
jgi:hypothetical protein